jgi:hypothetical protein
VDAPLVRSSVSSVSVNKPAKALERLCMWEDRMIVQGCWRRLVAAVWVLAVSSVIALAAAQSEPASERATTRQAPAGRAVVVVLDDLRIAPEARQDIVRALDVIQGALLGDDDLIGIASVGGASIYADLHFASKGERVRSAMAKFLAAPETRVRPEMATPTSARQVAAAALSTTFDIVGNLAKVRDRDLMILYAAPDAGVFEANRVTEAQALLSRLGDVPWPDRTGTGPGVTDADLVLQMAATLGRARQARVAIRVVNGLSPDQLMSRDVVRGN